MPQHDIARVAYAPGMWVAVAGPDVWLLAETTAEGKVASGCWEEIERGGGMDAVLGVIIREGLRSVPSFALAGRTSSGLRLLVSGMARAEITQPGSAPQMLDSGGAPTWIERQVEGPAGVRLSAGQVASAAALGLAGGVVLASVLSVDPPAAGAAAPVLRLAAPVARSASAPDEPEHDAVVLNLHSAPSPETRNPPDDGLLASGTTGEPDVARAHTLDHARATAPPADDAPTVLGSLPWRPAAPDLPPPVGAPVIAAAPEAAAPAPVEVSPQEQPPQEHRREDGPPVPAVACPNRHLNPPYSGRCRVCSAPVAPQEVFQAPRPVLGTLRLSTGVSVPLDRDAVLGRAPFDPAPGELRPHLIQLTSTANDISRSHLRVGLDGWQVRVIDLGSVNGTVVTVPGQPPVRLRPQDPFAIIPGTTISIADEVTAHFDVAPA